MKKNCFNCKFYDGSQYVCMYDYAVKDILNESTTGSKCSTFSAGKYDEEELDKTDYK